MVTLKRPQDAPQDAQDAPGRVTFADVLLRSLERRTSETGRLAARPRDRDGETLRARSIRDRETDGRRGLLCRLIYTKPNGWQVRFMPEKARGGIKEENITADPA